MNLEAQIELIERLADLDAVLKTLTDELSRERGALGGKRQRLVELQENHARVQGGVEDMDRLRGELTGESRQMHVQLERSREKLARCRSEREANAVQRELEELRKLQRDREHEVEKLQGLADQARAELAKLASERDALTAELGGSEGATVSRLDEVEREVAERTAQRKELGSGLPPPLLRKYDMIRARRGNSLARLQGGRCSACNIVLSPALVQQMQKQPAFEICPSCNRLLYIRPGRPADRADQAVP